MHAVAQVSGLETTIRQRRPSQHRARKSNRILLRGVRPEMSPCIACSWLFALLDKPSRQFRACCFRDWLEHAHAACWFSDDETVVTQPIDEIGDGEQFVVGIGWVNPPLLV